MALADTRHAWHQRLKNTMLLNAEASGNEEVELAARFLDG
jgi:hypothetical protein